MGVQVNKYSVANHLQENGWLLLSSEYKNLNTELEIKCPNGHEQKQTYGNWRKYMLCSKCMGNAAGSTILHNKIPEKNKEVKYRILALDAATNKTGYAIYDDTQLVAYGTFIAPKDKDVTERINKVKYWLIDLISECQVDGIVVENIQLQTGFGSSPQVELYRKLANLQGVIMDTLFELDTPSKLVYSTEWRKTCGISAKTREEQKEESQKAVLNWYGLSCTDDEADAICIGKYFTIKNKDRL